MFDDKNSVQWKAYIHAFYRTSDRALRNFSTKFKNSTDVKYEMEDYWIAAIYCYLIALAISFLFVFYRLCKLGHFQHVSSEEPSEGAATLTRDGDHNTPPDDNVVIYDEPVFHLVQFSNTGKRIALNFNWFVYWLVAIVIAVSVTESDVWSLTNWSTRTRWISKLRLENSIATVSFSLSGGLDYRVQLSFSLVFKVMHYGEWQSASSSHLQPEQQFRWNFLAPISII